VRFIPYGQGGEFPTKELLNLVYDALRQTRQSTVAIMTDEKTLEQLPPLDSESLEPERDYRWSGLLLQRKVQKRAKRIVQGTYDQWFQWYMRFQRFRAFHSIVLVEPLAGVANPEWGGYIDGLLARLMRKARRVVIISKSEGEVSPSHDEGRAKAVIRALLYGTRLSRPEILQQLGHIFIPIPDETLAKAFTKYHWLISKEHPRYKLEEADEELLQGMVAGYPPGYVQGKPDQIEQLFKRKTRFKRELKLPDEMISPRALEDVGRFAWVTAPFEAKRLSEWLGELNEQEDLRLQKIFRSHEYVSEDQGLRLLAPPRWQVRGVLDSLVEEGKLEKKTWYREVGRPAFAYVAQGKTPFLENGCGQCAFYIPDKRRCSIWWLANQTDPFFHPRWRQAGSRVTDFEIHKMRYASKIGPHSSACMRFLDRKRDHLRKAIPERCEICREAIPTSKSAVTCQNCATRYRYIPSKGRVRVMTAYQHEFNRIYHEATGGDAKADYEEHRRKVKENLRLRQAGMVMAEDLGDALAEEAQEREPEPPRVWPGYNEELQEEVDRLAQTTNIAKQLSVAMAQSALNATRRIIAFAEVNHRDAEPIGPRQEKYLALTNGANQSRLLPYEAQIMKQYWLCYGLALKGVPQVWFGPRKRSRYVKEFVRDPSARARGYSPVDAAVNYLHQRRLRQAERINQEVGFPGTCDGFLHRENYNSRKIGLLLDMIDPFKFADREELLLVFLDQGLTWKDFRIETDRRGSNFYYPMAAATAKMDQVGGAADNLVVKYLSIDLRLSEAYRLFAENLLQALEDIGTTQFKPFTFELPARAQ
jgi:hypothetical protein